MKTEEVLLFLLTTNQFWAFRTFLKKQKLKRTLWKKEKLFVDLFTF